MKIIFFLLTFFSEKLSEKDEELIEELQKQEYRMWSCYNIGLNFKNYFIDLYLGSDEHSPNSTEKDFRLSNYEKFLLGRSEGDLSDEFVEIYKNDIETLNDPGYLKITSKLGIFEAYYSKVYKEEDIDKLIRSLKNNDEFNYCIIFNCKKKEFVDVVKSFKKNLEMNQILRTEILYSYNNQTYTDSYYKFLYYIECHNDHIIIRSKKYINSEVFNEERKLSSEFLSKLVNYNYNLYFKELNDPKKEQLIRKYLLNHKLLLIDIDSLREDKKELREEFKRESKIPNIVYFNILFYFLKDSDVLKKIVRKSIDNCESESYFVFKRILKDLKIDFVDGYEILSSKTNKILIPPIKIINEYLIEDICNKIRMLKVKNDAHNYKKLLNYFYNYLKDNERIEVDELLEIIELFLTGDNFKKNNYEIFKKLFRYISYPENICCKNFFLYFYDTNKHSYFEKSIFSLY